MAWQVGRWPLSEDSVPSGPKITEIEIAQTRNLDLEAFSDPAEPDRSSHATWPSGRRSLGERAIKLGTATDAVNALVIDLFGQELELQLLAYHSCQESADGVLLPIGFLHHPRDRRARGRLQHGYDAGLF